MKFGCASWNSTPGKINKYVTFLLPMPTSDLKVPKWLFKNFPIHQTVYWNVNILLNITEISKVSESCLTEVVHIFNKIVHSRNPTCNRVFQRLWNALTTQWIWKQWPVNMLSEGITTSFCFWCWPAFWYKRGGQLASLWVKFATVQEAKLQSNARNMPGEGWSVLELTGT